MFITSITDCASPNDIGRQETRLATLFAQEHPHIRTVGIVHKIHEGGNDTIEASGHLIDILDAAEGRKGVILVNVANRHKNDTNKNNVSKKWENGTPFGYLWYEDVLIIASIDGYTLALLKKLHLADSIAIIDIPHVLAYIQKNHPSFLTHELAEYIKLSQFRSFDYLPRVARWLWDKLNIPSQPYDFSSVPDIGDRIWYIDTFGQAKTTLLDTDLRLIPGETVRTTIGQLSFYNRLKDVPNGESALIIGSSGIQEQRFLEIVVQGASAADRFHLHIADPFYII